MGNSYTIKVFDLDQPTKTTGRIYPEHVVHKAILDIQDQIKHGMFFGEMDTRGTADIDLTRVSHTVDDLYVKNGALFANITPIEHGLGEILQGLLNANFKPELALVGLGNVDDANKVHNLEIRKINVIAGG